ncbi:hypothetical protein V9T40_001842 [Parthenolecanium corni]|uniref:Peroxisomal multifunctional enzyme type 2 n=1 Tax=Parthenolecanium corni TaxID=536013 RepID=A0AAN9THA7_9HEMI
MAELRFDGRVVIVTGAGAGLGRAYALLFAARGASVVVNDLGSGKAGDGTSTKAADTVVQEIKAKGGIAAPDYNSVVDGEKIVQTALDNFGRIDVVVNNAGILRDRSFARISNNDWDIIHDVHLKGAFKVTQAAWPHFRKQNYGRVIVTSSNAGILGNFGQANYSAAKMGLVGLSNTLAIEGRKNNIHSNVIVPTAASRLTEGILPPDLFNELKPELIAPVVVWLCHESCEENGSIIDSSAGYAAKVQIFRGSGTLLRQKITDSFTPEDVRDKWSKVTDMTNPTPSGSIEESTFALMSQLDLLKSGAPSSSEAADEFSYGFKEAILYAIGIGSSVSVTSDLKYLFESHENFSLFPTFAIIPATIAILSSDHIAKAIPNKNFDLSQVLHGEQYLEILSPLSTESKLKTELTVVDVVDKGKGAVVVVDAYTYDSSGEKVAYNQLAAFVVGAGNFGGPKQSNKIKEFQNPPARSPDHSFVDKTLIDQAAIYRLSGDLNPLHIDPNFSILAGHKIPILHGLCSLGYAVRSVLYKYADNDPSLFKAVKVRFAKPVIPGQTLKTDMWKVGSRIFFQTSVVETKQAVLTGGYVDLHSVQESSAKLQLNRINAEELSSDLVFAGMLDRVKSDPSLLKKINGVFLYNITKDGKVVSTWTADLKTGEIYKGNAKKGTKVDTTITIDDSDMVDLALGKLNPQLAFVKGKLKLKGNILLAQKLKSLSVEPKL